MAYERKTHSTPTPGESVLAWLLRHERDRDGHRYTRKEVAEAAGISTSVLADYENGKTVPQLDTAQRLAEHLEITPRTLMLAVLPDAPKPPPGVNPSAALRETRRTRDFTYDQMARALHINPSLLRAYEEGLAVPASILNDASQLHYVPPERRREGASRPQGVPTDEPIPSSEQRVRGVGHLRERIYEIDAPEGESPAQDGESDPRGE